MYPIINIDISIDINIKILLALIELYKKIINIVVITSDNNIENVNLSLIIKMKMNNIHNIDPLSEIISFILN